jgi:hypothetical protein
VSFIGSREQSHLTTPVPRHERFAPLIPTLSDLAFLLPILVLFRSTTAVGWLLTDSDTGWHIRTGEVILQNGRVPAVDPADEGRWRHEGLPHAACSRLHTGFLCERLQEHGSGAFGSVLQLPSPFPDELP